MKLDLTGLRVTVMGLGVHGGGLSVAQYLVARGAHVTVTDLRDAETLASSIAALPPSCRTVIGRHEIEDFTDADLVVKNPAVPRHASYLQSAPAVTTDIALFLAEWSHMREAALANDPDDTHDADRSMAFTPIWRSYPDLLPLVAITGTKGKSTCSSLAAHIMRHVVPETRLGGNITVSPLGFVEDLSYDTPVVLELSSFQLGDLAFCREFNTRREAIIPPQLPTAVTRPYLPASVAVITNIFEDHQDYYSSMDPYVSDKQEVYRSLGDGGAAIIPSDSPWTQRFVEDLDNRVSPATRLGVNKRSEADPAIPPTLLVPGAHMRRNAAIAVAAARHIGIGERDISRALAQYSGIKHRLQLVAKIGNITFVNDTAATIPEATKAAVDAFLEDEKRRVYLIAGGSDKGLDPHPIVSGCLRVQQTGGAVALLEGSGTDRIVSEISKTQNEVPRFSSLADAFSYLLQEARTDQSCRTDWSAPTDRSASIEGRPDRIEDSRPTEAVILLSPGCASFGMFQNEFDRGNQFIALVEAERDNSAP